MGLEEAVGVVVAVFEGRDSPPPPVAVIKMETGTPFGRPPSSAVISSFPVRCRKEGGNGALRKPAVSSRKTVYSSGVSGDEGKPGSRGASQVSCTPPSVGEALSSRGGEGGRGTSGVGAGLSGSGLPVATLLGGEKPNRFSALVDTE